MDQIEKDGGGQLYGYINYGKIIWFWASNVFSGGRFRSTLCAKRKLEFR